MKECSYSLEINGVVKTFSNSYELDNFLIDYKNTFGTNQLSDIIFSTNNKQTEIHNILKDKEAKAVKILERKRNMVTGDEDYEGYGEYKGVTTLLTELKQPGTEKFLATPFNLDDYKKRQIDLYKLKAIKEGVPFNEQAARSEIEATIKTWDIMAKNGTRLHKVAEEYFKGNDTYDSLIELFPDLKPEIVGSMINQLSEFRNELYKRHGEDAIFLPEYRVSNDQLQLVGIIDLLVVDNSGQVHLYDFKTSHKASEDWIKVKEQTYDYQLGFYRHALAAYGLPVKKAYLGIVPIRIDGADYQSNTYDKVVFEETQDRLNRQGLPSGTANRLEWGVGKYSNIINHFITIKAQNNVVTSDFLNTVNQQLKKAFPLYEFKLKKVFNNVEKFKKEFVKEATKQGYKWTFWNSLESRREFAKTDEELNTLVEKYIQSQTDNASSEIERTAESIAKVIQNKEELHTLEYRFSRDIGFFPQKIRKYIGTNWEVIEDIPELTKLGIIAIQNTQSGYIDFLSVTINDLIQNKHNLGLGTTILGAFKKDDTYLNNPEMLSAIGGNIELMKVMFALNNLPQLFNGNLKIGQITAVNPYYSQAVYADPGKLGYTFDRLTLAADVQNNFKGDDLVFATNMELFSDILEGAIANNPSDSRYNKILTVFEDSPVSIDAKVEDLEKLRNTILNSFRQLKTAKLADLADRPESQLITLIDKQIFDLKGIKISQTIQDPNKWSLGSGLYFNNPDTQRDPNLRLISTLINRGFQRTADEYLGWQQNFRKVLQQFKDASNYSGAEENLLGFQNKLYRNLFRKTEDNTQLAPEFLFKDPSHSSLEPHEKKFLEYILWEINSRRFRIYDKFDPQIDELKQGGQWYQVPLQKGSSQSRMQQSNTYKDAFSRFWNVVKHPKEIAKMAKRAVNDALDEDTQKLVEDQQELYEMYNRFEIGETNRQKLLLEHPLSYFEHNLEDLTGAFIFSKIRKQQMDEVLPEVRAIVSVIRFDAENFGLTLEKYDSYIEDFIKSAVFNMSLIEDEMKPIYQFAQTIKAATSKLTLGFNSRSGIREIVQGLWRNIGTSFIRQYGKEQFGQEEYAKSLGVLIGDNATNFMSHIDTVESLNVQYRMANMDINALVDRLTTNKKGLAALNSRWMFWWTTCPDYFNRMSIFIAQMIKDGSWDAHIMKDGVLTYDWKKDNRFAAYAKGDRSNPDYNLQRAKYLKLMEELSEEGVTNKNGMPLKEGDDLLRAYSSRERDSLKSFADMMYGYYDHEDKALVNNVFFGALWLQFRTFFSASKNRYFLSRGEYKQGNLYNHVEDEQGNKLYYTITENEDGTTTKNITTNSENALPLLEWKGRIMEGIVTSFIETLKEWKENGYDAALDKFKNDPVKIANMKWLIYDLLMWMLFGLIMASIIYTWRAERQKDRRVSEVDDIVHLQDGLTDMFSSALTGSTDDFFIGNVLWQTAFDWQPPAFRIMKNIENDLGKMFIGDKDLTKVVIDNVGMLRAHKYALYGLENKYLSSEE